MKLGIFGGSFDPVHKEHVRMAETAIKVLSLDVLFVVPSKVAPHKRFGAEASGEDRARMCEIAFSKIPKAEISRFELSSDGLSYSYLTCRHFAEQYPKAERYFLVGADMLEDFFGWKNPEEILKCATLTACGRETPIASEIKRKFFDRFHCEYKSLDFCGENISSTEIRVSLAFGKNAEGISEEVRDYIKAHELYLIPTIRSALMLETPNRREHSFRVAQMACARAKSLKIPFHRALMAAALHDCGKSVPLSSPLLKDFSPPQSPEPVMHQFVGAYLAEHLFQIEDEDVLNAIRFHTSGRKGMSDLEKLIFLSDALEAGRDYPHVDELRALFWRDLDECLVAFFKEQLKYLEEKGKPIYPLTTEAYHWICQTKNAF